MVVVAGLLDDRWKVEIEAEATRGVQIGPDRSCAAPERTKGFVKCRN
jgi:hypothetical protein